MSILSLQKQSQNTDFPNLRPSLDIRFALAKKLDPRITFTRGGPGTYFGPDGLMRTAGVNEPRFDHDPITGQSLGLLIEESRTNQITRGDIEGTVGAQPTGMFLAGPINGQTAIVSTDVFLGPNGQSCKHTRGVYSDNNIGYIDSGSITAGSTYVFSAYVYIPSSQAKNFEGKLLRFSMESPNTGATLASADVTIVDRWQRVFGTCVPSTTSATWVLRTTANTGSFFYTDCWQLELGSLPTSYIPASGGSQLTRSADLASMEGINFSSWYNQSEGTIYMELDKLYSGNFDAYRHFFAIDDGSSSNAISDYTLPSSTFVTQYGITNGGRQVFDYQQLNVGSSAIKYKLGHSLNSKYSFFTLSTQRGTPQLSSRAAPNGQNLSLPTNMTRLFIGNARGTNQMNSHISRFTYYPIQITNQQLINLTS